ncbi:hypothetical protein FOZ63_003044, partial [Perkinsus olseni]
AVGGCDPNDLACFDAYVKRFRFYLAFENSKCRWYMTEKLWKELHARCLSEPLLVVYVTLLGSIAEDEEALGQPDLIVLDVTSEEKYKEGHHPDAINIPTPLIGERIGELGNDKTRPILVYCKKGVRAGMVTNTLRQNGFINAFATTDKDIAQMMTDKFGMVFPSSLTPSSDISTYAAVGVGGVLLGGLIAAAYTRCTPSKEARRDKVPSIPQLPTEDGRVWFSEVSDEMWPGQAMSLEISKVLYHKRSRFQDIMVFDSTKWGRVLCLDGAFQTTDKDEC